MGQLDVNGGSHTGSHVGGARGDDTEIGRFGTTTGDQFLDNINGSFKSVRDIVDHGRFFHGHNSQVIFFTNPDNETFVSGDVTTSTIRPVTSNTGGNQVAIISHVLNIIWALTNSLYR